MKRSASNSVIINGLFFGFLLVLLFGGSPWAAEPPQKRELKTFLNNLQRRGVEYGWTDVKPGAVEWQSHRTSQLNRPMVFAQFGSPTGPCTLLLGGVHRDELPTVYIMLRLAQYMKYNPAIFKEKCVVIAPLVNPDGFFSKPPPKRVNARGVDINRNFPTREWSTNALRDWEKKYNKNKRYYPGKKGGSEQETMFQIALIKRFKPQKILSAHSPLNGYDFDGPSSDLDSFSQWLETVSRETSHPIKKFGCFPGSLGNYAGQERGIFTLTLELPTSDPGKGDRYYQQFEPAIIKFLDLPISSSSPLQ
ncbi:MAG: M14 family zinc carboxypeptidase [Proteobacteria bacterium]|nr:M14 family zinc carboxypeptidase [Pseudomonadota bacterium]